MLLKLDQLESNLTKKNFKKLDPLMLLEYSCYNFRRSSIHNSRSIMMWHMESLKESIQERAKHKQEYDRTMQSKVGKVASSKTLDARLIVTECSGTKSDKQDTSSRSGNDADTEDAETRLVNDLAPLAE
ncbi:hypothetical protein Tco_0275069, partial [Tanacetum coccineum]